MKLSSILLPRWWVRVVLVAGLLVGTGLAATPTEARSPATTSAAPVGAARWAATVSHQDREDDDARKRNDDGEDNEEDGITETETTIFDPDWRDGGGGPNNIVRLRNRQDGRFRIRGNIDLNRIHGSRVTPRNVASAVATCTDCQTVAIALQLNLYQRTAAWVAPENLAVALNIECTRCTTVAVAIQYVLPVDDPNDTPEDVDKLIREMDRELRDIHSDKGISLTEAETRINTVIARFVELANSLDEKRAEATEQTSATVTPTVTATVTPTVSPSPTDAAPSASGVGAPAETPTVTPTEIPTSTLATPSASPTP